MHARLSSMVLVTALVASAQGWVNVTPPGSPPPFNNGPVAMTYDEVNDCVVLVGYRDNVVGYETWIFSGGLWGQVPAVNSAALIVPMSNFPAHELVFDVASGAPLLAVTDSANIQNASLQLYSFVNGGWIPNAAPPTVVVQNGVWSQIGTVLMSDRGHAESLLYVNTSIGPSNHSWTELFAFNGATWSRRVMGWTPAAVAWGGAVSFYDEVRGRLVAMTPYSPSYFEWDGTAWSQAYPSFTSDTGRVAYCPSMGRAIGLTAAVTQIPSQYGQPLNVPVERTIAYGDLSVREIHPEGHPSYHSSFCITCDRRRNVVIDYDYNGDTWELAPGPASGYSVSGTGCAGSRGTPALAPQFGAQVSAGYPFTLQAANLPWFGPTFLFFGASNQRYGSAVLPFDLTPVGAPSCLLQCSGDVMVAMPSILGTAAYSVTLPSIPGIVFFNQAIALDSSANALGLTLSNLGRGQIGY